MTSLPSQVTPMISASWQDYSQQISLLEESDFLIAPIVTKTLHAGLSPNALAEREFLHNSRFLPFVLPNNGTSIHQAYALTLYEQYAKPLSSVSSILEFGAGYGEMARMILSSGWSGKYYIYDLPSLFRFQRYHLAHHAKSVQFLSHPVQLEALGMFTDLLIGICSLSEAPLVLRHYVFSAFPNSLLIRYQTMWDNIDNRAYFASIASHYDKSLVLPVPEFPSHEFLIAF